jgi:hypothetical protein
VAEAAVGPELALTSVSKLVAHRLRALTLPVLLAFAFSFIGFAFALPISISKRTLLVRWVGLLG